MIAWKKHIHTFSFPPYHGKPPSIVGGDFSWKKIKVKEKY
jgi:hypothetical protein